MQLKLSKVICWVLLWVSPTGLALSTKSLVPSKITNSFLVTYAPIEKFWIKKDLDNIRELTLAQAQRGQKKLIYVATAGGPGASKTTILETYLHQHPGFVYIDPDQRALKFMLNTYWQGLTNYEISKTKNYRSLLKSSYTKWRGAANYIATTILNEAFSNNLAIAHGTTSTAKSLEGFYQTLHAKGYKIILLLCGTTLENRINAISHRQTNHCFIQSTRVDMLQKGRLFYENFPLYFKYADEIHFFWIEEFDLGWQKVAVYTKPRGLRKINKDLLKFIEAYENFRTTTIDLKLPAFNALLLAK